LRQLQSDKTKSETAGSTSSVVVDRRSKSPPPRRVRFENEYVDYNDAYGDYTTENRRRFSGYGQGVFRERGFREFRMGRGHGNGPPISQWGDGNYQFPFRVGAFRGYGATRFRGRPMRRGGMAAPQWMTSNQQFCGKCGYEPHPHPNMCPAVNQTCRGCLRKGHFLRVCRAIGQAQTRSE